MTGTLSAAHRRRGANATAPVIYQGIPHTAIGNAVLQPDSERNMLDVRTSDPNARKDGVAMRLRAEHDGLDRTCGNREWGLPLVMTLNSIAVLVQRISTRCCVRSTIASFSERSSRATRFSFAVLV